MEDRMNHKKYLLGLIIVVMALSFIPLSFASDPIPNITQVSATPAIDLSTVSIGGMGWEKVSSGDLLRLYYMKLGQEQLMKPKEESAVTVSSPVTSGTAVPSDPIPNRSLQGIQKLRTQ